MARDTQPEETTHFGFEPVPAGEKASRVREVFDSVTGRYDLMNDLMSLGVHRLWKSFSIHLAAIRKGDRVLDLACGTGDLSKLLAQRVGDRGLVIASDINRSMLERGRDRLLDSGIFGNVAFVQANAESLPFPDDAFDAVSIGFGLRNVTDKTAALRAMYRVLRSGGQLQILEFSHPTTAALAKAYDAYSFKILPFLGKHIAGDERSYRYLAESVRMHPAQDELRQMMESVGFVCCDYLNLSGGIVALHRGHKA